MLIDGKDFKINVLILLMEDEVDVTVLTVETLLDGLEDGVVISVLLNGGSNPALRELLAGCGSIRYYESDKNLGVAGGRNYLFRTRECMESEIVIILDNDVVPPFDYISRLAGFLLRQENAGIVGPVIADIKKGAELYKAKYSGHRGVFGGNIYKVTSAEIKAELIDQLKPGKLFHIGVHPDYYYAYLSSKPWLYAFANTFLKIFGAKYDYAPFLNSNRKYLDMIKKGVDRYEVSNVGGGSSVFRRRLLDEIGQLDDRFNPYGFEDVDFSIRALKAGYKNYIDTNTWLLHGTDSRHKVRDLYRIAANNFRCRTILASLIFPAPRKYRLVILKMIFAIFIMEAVTMRPDFIKLFKARLGGYRMGLEVIDGKKSLEMNLRGS